MNNKLSPTETISKDKKSIDNLSSLDALKVMLVNQNKAISAVSKSINSIKKTVDIIYKNLKQNNTSRLIYVGAGTSGRICLQDGSELHPTFGWPKNRISYLIAGGLEAVLSSVEGAEDNKKICVTEVKNLNLTKNDTVIGVAASGNTPYTVEIINQANKFSATTIGISNNPNGELLKSSDYQIILKTGEEVISGSTRLTAGTAQKICLNLITTLVMVKLGRVKNGQMTHMVVSNQKLRERKKRIDEFLNDK